MQKSYIAVKALIKKNSFFLILKKKKSDQNNKTSGWETPGGRLKKNEDLLTGLEREIKEETGLTVKILFPFNAYLANVDRDDSIVGINYLADYKSGNVVLDYDEHSKFQWLNISDIRKLKDSIGLQKEINAYENFLLERKKQK